MARPASAPTITRITTGAFVFDPEGNNLEVVCHADPATPKPVAARAAAKPKPPAGKAKVKVKAAAKNKPKPKAKAAKRGVKKRR